MMATKTEPKRAVDRPKTFLDARGKALRSCHLMTNGARHWAVRVGDVSVLLDYKAGADLCWALLGKLQAIQRNGHGGGAA